MEAGCLELSVLIAVVLRDALAVVRVVTVARAPQTPVSVLSRLLNGFNVLKDYTNTQW